MKKLTALFLSLAMVVGLAACSSGAPSSSESSAPETSVPQATSESDETSSVGSENTDADTSKTWWSTSLPVATPKKQPTISRRSPEAICSS